MSGLLPLDPAQLLSTTRAGRKRLDLTRPMPRSVIEECLALAVQAPPGSNRQAWQFVLIDNPVKKKALADFYGAVFDDYAKAPAIASYQPGDVRAERREAVAASAKYPLEHYHEVPVPMPAYQEGRLDGEAAARQPGYWGSILSAVWSFMLALRARASGQRGPR